jgi:hypothetical protein
MRITGRVLWLRDGFLIEGRASILGVSMEFMRLELALQLVVVLLMALAVLVLILKR